MRIFDTILRALTGILFVFSGLVKLNDPMGMAIKLEEYFEVFATDFGQFFHSFIPMALPLSVFVCVLEVVLGIALLINYRFKISIWLLLLLIVFFTFLTFYSAYFDKVTDCGCFGDAIPLTPWQSFSKDVILLIVLIYLFFRKSNIQTDKNPIVKDIALGASVLASIGIAIYAIEHLPYIDFRPYHVGANIPVYMKPSAPYQYKYIMEKDGKKEEFLQYPSDTTYKYVDMVLLNPEAEPKIADFSIWNDDGDFTEDCLSGVKLLVLFQNVSKIDDKDMQGVNALLPALPADVEIWAITSNDASSFENFRHQYQLAYPYYFVDGTVAKAIVRSNPGMILLRDGIVLGKWHHNDIPQLADVEALLAK